MAETVSDPGGYREMAKEESARTETQTDAGRHGHAPAGVYQSAPERVRVTRLVFAYLSWVALVGMAVFVAIHPTAHTNPTLTMILGALIGMTNQTFRFIYGGKDGA